MKRTTKLRELLSTGESIVVPGCYNAMSARVLDKVGFPAIYMTGYGTSLSLLGMPDAGLATMTEMHMNARYIANAVSVPVIADSDNGYGNAVNTIRTVKEYVQTGVAAIHIEDQVIPKRCGHVAGRRVIPIDEAVGKYRAADYARKEIDPDFVIIARTDARGAHGGTLDDAITRANAYLEAGADVAFVEGPTDVEEVKRICSRGQGSDPLQSDRYFAALHAWRSCSRSASPLRSLPGATFRTTMMAIYDLAVELRDEGPIAEEAFQRQVQGSPDGRSAYVCGLRSGHGLGEGVFGRRGTRQVCRLGRTPAQS